MVFYGNVVGNKRCKVEITDGGSIYLLQVCLEAASKSETTSLYIQPSNQKEGFLICHLGPQLTQFSLCHELVSEDSPIEFWTTGGKVHITGTTQDAESDDDEDDHEHDDEDEEEEEVFAQECAPTINTKAAKAVEKRARPAEVIEIAEPVKAVKKTKTAAPLPTGAEVAADVVIPQTHQQRKKWKIKPQNDEGVLVLEPKLLKKATGISITDYIIGKGAEPKLGAKVKITYEGSFPDGTIFDQRITRAKPFSFRKGTAQVIRGLDFGLDGMRIGGSREILIPPELG